MSARPEVEPFADEHLAGAAVLLADRHARQRSGGAGLALTEGVFAWARENGYTTIVVDWRVPNLLSSRFWPARGFRTSFLRLHRTVG